MQNQPVIEGTRGLLVHYGLGTPAARAVSAAIVAGGVSYALRRPAHCFRRNGTMRPLAGLSPELDAAGYDHFLLIPVVVGTAAFLFT
jgi:hypothetical protein